MYINVTIKDVAKAAGVSVATVSRVINGSSSVSDEKKKMVNEAIRDLGFNPNQLAHNLRKRETKNILVIIPSTENTFYSEIIRGMEDEVNHEFDIILASSYSYVHTEVRLLGMMTNHLVDAAVILGSRLTGAQIDEYSSHYHIALASENIENSHVLTVLIDNEKAAYEAVDRFIAIGLDRVALVTTNTDIIAPTSDNRLKGYLKALRSNGIEVSPELIYRGDYSFESGMAAAKHFMSLSAPPKAVFCISDILAAGCSKAYSAAGYTVGKDIQICGFDNIPLCSFVTPTLTTVAQPGYKMGRTVAARLLSDIKNNTYSTDTVMLDHEIIVRESAIL
ncbi:MAG: LacI family DNA-binding transcriptional regulator [Oscillospiraceae bacterium]|nr:LacI family DNA-binding transcriptional regulator [Oscillospiraceae bacterium]